MSDQDFFEAGVKPKRSTLLTVLCILTFIGSGWGVLSSAASFFTKPAAMQKIQENQAKALEQIKENKTEKNAFALKIVESSAAMLDPEKVKLSNIFQLVASILSLTGALFMFKQNIGGYPVYIAGCILSIAGVIYIFGAHNFTASISVSVSGFFSVVFIVLYTMCLKEMRPQKNIV